MKKFLLCAGLLLLVGGLGLSRIGVSMGGETVSSVHLFGRSWNVYAPTGVWSSASTTVHETKPAILRGTRDVYDYGYAEATQEPPQATMTDSINTPFSSIYLDVDLGDVTIVAGDDFMVEIECWGKGYQVNHWYSGETLHIENKDSGINLIPSTFGSNITVYVPSGAWLDSLYVDLDLGSLTLAGLQLGYADIDLDLGSLTGEALAVTGKFQVDADLGEVVLFGDLGEYVDISADLGSVQLGLSHPASEYSWTLEADLGSVTVDGKDQRLGEDHEVTGGHGDRSIVVDADLGSITLDFGQDFGRAFPPAEVQQEATTYTAEDKGGAVSSDVWMETE